jgi:hypothetical protein
MVQIQLLPCTAAPRACFLSESHCVCMSSNSAHACDDLPVQHVWDCTKLALSPAYPLICHANCIHQNSYAHLQVGCPAATAEQRWRLQLMSGSRQDVRMPDDPARRHRPPSIPRCRLRSAQTSGQGAHAPHPTPPMQAGRHSRGQAGQQVCSESHAAPRHKADHCICWIML